ncbi:hypothetical protein SDJN03_07431, partial [Cucurbita argyrosperma subsp. sororia]
MCKHGWACMVPYNGHHATRRLVPKARGKYQCHFLLPHPSEFLSQRLGLLKTSRNQVLRGFLVTLKTFSSSGAKSNVLSQSYSGVLDAKA